MMTKDKLALIVGVGKPKGRTEDDDVDSGSDEMDDESTVAAEDLLAAVRSKDPGAVVDAFKAMLSACRDDYGDDTEE